MASEAMPTTPAAEEQSKPCYFFELPVEVRDIIYDYLIPNQIVRLRKYRGSMRFSKFRQQADSGPQQVAALMTARRQIYKEVSKIAFARTTFIIYVHVNTGMHRFDLDPSDYHVVRQVNNSTFLAQARHVKIDFKGDSWDMAKTYRELPTELEKLLEKLNYGSGVRTMSIEARVTDTLSGGLSWKILKLFRKLECDPKLAVESKYGAIAASIKEFEESLKPVNDVSIFLLKF